MQHRVLFIDFNSYFASVEQQLVPELRGRPIAVVPVMTDSTCAIAASYEAKAFGVKTGTGIREAKQMCPGLVCVKARHDAYVYYHDLLKKEIDRHIPILSVESIDEMACELYGAYHAPDRAVELAQDASYFAASARISSLRVRSMREERFRRAEYRAVWKKPLEMFS